MSKPVRIRVRGTESVREWWMKAKGTFDLTHAQLALEGARFLLENEQEFRRHLQSDERDSETEER